MAAPVIAPRRPVAPRKPASSRKPAARKPSSRKASTATTREERNDRALAKARATQRARPAAQRARAIAAPSPAPARRKSGAAKARTRPAASPVARVLNSRGMPLLDRILRGPGWVVMLGALLAGIVFLNVSVLELNRGIARTDSKSAQVERVNSALRARVAKLNSGERIQALAAARGFVMPEPGDVTYVHERDSNASLAAQRMTPPDTTTTTTPTTATTPAPAPTSSLSPASTTVTQPTTTTP
jgi:cell division protein FtsB